MKIIISNSIKPKINTVSVLYAIFYCQRVVTFIAYTGIYISKLYNFRNIFRRTNEKTPKLIFMVGQYRVLVNLCDKYPEK